MKSPKSPATEEQTVTDMWRYVEVGPSYHQGGNKEIETTTNEGLINV